ncbi:MAG: DUF3482 domain-containing protein [Phycisphaerae bacterium]|nr:DUF3482 domain-containing protein [Phycisphaerae bacterium]
MTPASPRIAVVGHTNVGKTSLLRTLLRDARFGDVSDRPATTRHAEAAEMRAQLRADARSSHGSGGLRRDCAIIVTDTPGLEDSSGLLELLESIDPSPRSDPHTRVMRWLESPDTRFAQEAKAVRQVLDNDIAIYVIDARERMLGRHRDELTILAACARPIVPVLNFVESSAAHAQQVADWRDQLARIGLHAVVAFDTMIVDEASERRLYEALRTLAPKHQETFDAFIQSRAQQREHLVEMSAALIADMLIDAAACVRHVDPNDRAAVQQAVAALQAALAAREQRCVDDLLALHRFRAEDWVDANLPVVDGRWGLDLFHPSAMKELGLTTGRGAAVGAMAGLAVDAVVGGMTLGAAAATGAGIGAMFEAARGNGARWLRRLRGIDELRADDATIHLLALRELSLLRALLRRGHAAQSPMRVAQDSLVERVRSLARTASGWSMPEPLQIARLHPQWSALSSIDGMLAFEAASDPDRAAAAMSVAQLLREATRREAADPARFP